MKYIIIIVLIVLYVLWIKKRKKDKSYTAICLAGGLGVLVIAFLSLTTYVTWHNPYTSMEKVLEEKTGTDLLLTDKKSYGEVFQWFWDRRSFEATFVDSQNSNIEYKCYAFLNEKKNGYNYNSNYYNICYRKQLKRELEEIGKDIWGEDILVWYYTGLYLPLEEDYTYEEFIDEVKKFNMTIMVDKISDVDAINGAYKFLDALEQRGIKSELFSVERNADYTEEELKANYERDDYRDELHTFFNDVLLEKGYKIADENAIETARPISQSIREKYKVYEKNEKLGYIVTIRDGKKGVVDYEGNVLVECLYDEVTLRDNDKFLWLEQGHYFRDEEIKTEGFIYLPTKSVVKGKYSGMYDRGEYLLVEVSETGDGENEELIYGALDLYCNEIIPCNYARIRTFGDRIEATKRDGVLEFFDFNGNKVKKRD